MKRLALTILCLASAASAASAAPPARTQAVTDVILHSAEPRPIERGSHTLTAVCAGRVSQLILPLHGKHGGRVARWRYAGVEHSSPSLQRLAADLNRPELFYQYAFRCDPAGRGVILYAMAVSFEGREGPAYLQARASISNRGVVSDYEGLVASSYEDLRSIVTPSGR